MKYDFINQGLLKHRNSLIGRFVPDPEKRTQEGENWRPDFFALAGSSRQYVRNMEGSDRKGNREPEGMKQIL